MASKRSLRTSVTGPGRFDFWWKVSSRASHDGLLIFNLDGVELRRSRTLLGRCRLDTQVRVADCRRSSHTWPGLRQDVSFVVAGQDAGWVANAAYAPGYNYWSPVPGLVPARSRCLPPRLTTYASGSTAQLTATPDPGAISRAGRRCDGHHESAQRDDDREQEYCCDLQGESSARLWERRNSAWVTGWKCRLVQPAICHRKRFHRRAERRDWQQSVDFHADDSEREGDRSFSWKVSSEANSIS